MSYKEGRCDGCKRLNGCLTLDKNEKGDDIWLCIFCLLSKGER